jgi:hypothetical protein
LLTRRRSPAHSTRIRRRAFAAGRLRAVAARVPDRQSRAAFVRTGLGLSGGETALAAADTIAAAITDDEALLTEERWPELRALILYGAITVTEIIRTAERTAAAVAAIGLADPMEFAKALDNLVVSDLAWVTSAILLLITERTGFPVAGPARALPAMPKFGCPPRRRASRPAPVPTTAGTPWPRPGRFRSAPPRASPSSVAGRPRCGHDEIAAIIGPEIARVFLCHVAAFTTPDNVLDLLAAGPSPSRCPACGTAGRRHPRPPAALEREQGNAFDANAIAVRAEGERVGCMVRESAGFWPRCSTTRTAPPPRSPRRWPPGPPAPA